MHDEIRVAGEHVAICGEVALLVLLARRDGELETRERRVERRRGARATDRTARVAGSEAVPVFARWTQAIDLGVNRVCPLGRGVLEPFAYDVLHLVVGGDFPLDSD